MKMLVSTTETNQLKEMTKMLWSLKRHFYTRMIGSGTVEVVVPEYDENDERDYDNLNRIIAILEARRLPDVQEAIENMDLMFDYKELPGPFFDTKYLLEKWVEYYKYIGWDALEKCESVVFWLNEMLDNYESVNDIKQILIYLFTIGKDKPSYMIRDIYQKSSGLPLSFFK